MDASMGNRFWIFNVAYFGADSTKLLLYLTIKNITNYDEYKPETLTLMPRIFTFFDGSLGLIITTLLLLCPYYW